MYTVIVMGIILFPWTLVAVTLIGWLVQRNRRALARANRTREELRRTA